jgi:hypothetical protein
VIELVVHQRILPIVKGLWTPSSSTLKLTLAFFTIPCKVPGNPALQGSRRPISPAAELSIDLVFVRGIQ